MQNSRKKIDFVAVDKFYVKCNKMSFNLMILNMLREKLNLKCCKKKKERLFFLKQTKIERR